jgi:hypothetical protein
MIKDRLKGGSGTEFRSVSDFRQRVKGEVVQHFLGREAGLWACKWDWEFGSGAFGVYI